MGNKSRVHQNKQTRLTRGSAGVKMMINDQLILEEDYDENYVPTEEGMLFVTQFDDHGNII